MATVSVEKQRAVSSASATFRRKIDVGLKMTTPLRSGHGIPSRAHQQAVIRNCDSGECGYEI
jgi:hypothetical protein